MTAAEDDRSQRSDCGSSDDVKARIADRFAEADRETDRFINVTDGEKGTHDHDTRCSDPRNVRSQNYGIYPGDGLVYLDVDDYGDSTADKGLAAIRDLQETLTTESPHTDGDLGGHRFYRVTGDAVDALEAAFGTANPQPSWGEVRAHNQYVTGPGSELDSCDKDWHDCSEPGEGHYTIASDEPIATITAEELVDALEADPDLAGADGHSDDRDGAPDGRETRGEYDPAGTSVETLAERETDVAKYLAAGAKAAGFKTNDGAGDRSRADYRVCCLAIEYGVPEADIRERLDDCEHSKVGASDAARDYWQRTWSKALANVDNPNSKAPATQSGTESSAIFPREVLEAAAVSPVCPVERDEDGDLPPLRDLRDSEKAEFVWQLATEKGRDRVIAVEGGPLYRYEDGVWHRDKDATHLRNIGHEALESAYSGSVLNELEERARSTNSIQAGTLGAPAGTVATDASLLDMKPAIESGDIHDIGLESLHPEHYARHKVPIEPDPNADAPRFEAFIEESVADGERMKLQEYAGYVLWHHAQPFGKALFLLGPTDSGKGTFLRILKGILGGEDAPLAAESLQDLTGRWGAAKLFGNWANVRNEVTPGDIDDIQKFKEFTGGGDRVSAEFKGQDKFEFDVTQKFLFAMNQLPDIDNTDRAFWNRLLLVQFPETVPEEEQDKTLDETIVAEEAAGVLNWMLAGLIRLFDQEGFTNERDINEKRELVGQYGDVFDRFIDDIVERTGDDHDYVVKRDLLALANAYADAHDMDTPWNGQRGFSRRVHAQGIGSMRTSHGFDDRTRVFTGVSIDENAPDAFGVDVDHGNLTDGQADSDDEDSDITQQSLDSRQ